MNISERNIKLLLLLAFAAIIALPFFLIIQPTQEELKVKQGEVAALKAEKERLDALAIQVPTCQEAIAAYATGIKTMLTPYPGGILQEAELIFIDRTEKLLPIQLKSVGFSEPEISSITVSEEPVATELEGEDITVATNENGIGDVLNGGKMNMSLQYELGYYEFKEFLRYIKTNENRYVIPTISISYDSLNKKVTGSFTLIAYAVYGINRPAVEVNEPVMDLGTLQIFLNENSLTEEIVIDVDSDDVDEAE